MNTARSSTVKRQLVLPRRMLATGLGAVMLVCAAPSYAQRVVGHVSLLPADAGLNTAGNVWVMEVNQAGDELYLISPGRGITQLRPSPFAAGGEIRDTPGRNRPIEPARPDDETGTRTSGFRSKSGGDDV